MKKMKSESLICHIILILLSGICVMPITLVFTNSFKLHQDIVSNPLSLSFTAGVSNFVHEWQAGKFGRAYLNSFFFVASTIIVVLILSFFAAYALNQKTVRGRKGIMIYLMLAMTVPLQLFMSPLYMVYAKLNLLGNVIAVSIILAACNIPFSVMLLRTFMLGIPSEMEEAAVMDGATTWQVLTKIILPISKAGLLTSGIIVGLNAWNDFLISSTFLVGEQNFTASLVLVSFNGAFATDIGMNMAGAVILIIPILTAFLLAQRYFIDGLTMGSVKG